MINFYIDPITKDLALTDSKDLRLTVNNAEFVSQKIENKFLFFAGEWFLNRELGIPYLNLDDINSEDSSKNIFVKNPDLNFINNIYVNELNTMINNGEIIEIISFNSEFDTSSRQLSIDLEVRIPEGEILPLEIII